MQCDKCTFDKGKEYFDVPLDDKGGRANLCAKCYSEGWFRATPYFRDILSNFGVKIPVKEHYISANMFRFLVNNRSQIPRIIEEQHKGRVPSSIEVNFKKIESQLIYSNGEFITSLGTLLIWGDNQ
jgi:hypothetical protein